MKKIIFANILFLNLFLKAEIDPFVLIEGQIGNAFNKTEVLIIDEFDQKYYLPKTLFPSNFKFVAGEKFEIEMSKEKFDQIKVDRM